MTSGESSKLSDANKAFKPPPEAPTLHPTIEEFENPLKFFEQIFALGTEYGIVKIVPPEQWSMYFALDIGNLNFKVRKQQLSELDVKNRSAKYFHDKLTQYWSMHGHTLTKKSIERAPINFYKLKTLVHKFGGFEMIEKNNHWDEITKILLEKETFIIEARKQIRSIYCDIIEPYEKFGRLRQERRKAEEKNKDVLINYFPKSKRENEEKNQAPSRLAMITETNIESLNKSLCMNCYNQDQEEMMLICYNCGDYYHTFCLIPPLSGIPADIWKCPLCCATHKRNEEAFSFEQREQEYNLDTYQRKAIAWKKRYFRSTSEELTCEFIEKKYWSIYQDEPQLVVEYGTDLPCSDYGSGFPTTDSKNSLHPSYQQMVHCKWNLNNLPKLNGSVLKYMPEISGVTSPWLYFGMCFSTFCWHVEDHWLPSVNYLHCGEPKTWYGIPSLKAEMFENYLKTTYSDLFDDQPDLLHHLTLMVNPEELLEAGIPVYRLDQTEGQFVITFPRAYHAGFNQGFNIAEAVNFATLDWLMVGQMSVYSYAQMKRKCVFSHDRLLYNVVQDYENIDEKYIYQVYLGFLHMISQEYKFREELGQVISRIPSENFSESDCEVCNTSCFLSIVTCGCGKRSCLEHPDKLCSECPLSEFKLKERFSMAHLTNMMFNLVARSSHYRNWRDFGLEIITMGKVTTTRYDLEKWIRVGKERKYPDWQLITQISNYLNEITETFSHIFVEDLEETSESTCSMMELQECIQQFSAYPFRLVEFKHAFNIYRGCLEFENHAKTILNQRTATINKDSLEKILHLKSHIKNISLPCYRMLNARYLQIKWFKETSEALKTPSELTLEQLENFITTSSNWKKESPFKELINNIQKQIAIAKSWESEADVWLTGKRVLDKYKLKRTIRYGNELKIKLPSMEKMVELLKTIDPFYK